MKKFKFVLIGVFILMASAIAYSVLRHNAVKDVATKDKPNVRAVVKKQTKAMQEENQNVSKGNILITSNSEALYKILHPTIDEYYKDDAVDAIVEGTITDVDYYAYSTDNAAKTLLTINVSKSIKGNTTKTIKVYEDGGYIKFKDVIGEFDGHIDVKKLTKEQIENGIVDIKFENAPHSKADQTVVLFLNRNPNVGQTDTFQIVSGPYGKFTLDINDGNFKRISLNAKEEASDTDSQSRLKQGNLPVSDFAARFETSVPKADMENKLKNMN